MRQSGLVDDAKGVFADGPDGTGMLAADLHLGAVASMEGYWENFAYQAASFGRVARQSRSPSRKSIKPRAQPTEISPMVGSAAKETRSSASNTLRTCDSRLAMMSALRSSAGRN